MVEITLSFARFRTHLLRFLVFFGSNLERTVGEWGPSSAAHNWILSGELNDEKTLSIFTSSERQSTNDDDDDDDEWFLWCV